MALTRSFPTQHPSGLPITDTRRVTAGLITRNADGTPRAGIFPSNANPIVSGRASMGYDVAPFLAATSRINTGVELIANDAVTIVPTTAAPPSNSRIDVIWVRAQFVQHADANNDVVFGVTQGVAAAVPSKPAIPVGALELATATILSTTTTTATVVITQTYQFTASAGAVVLVRSLAERDAWLAPANAIVRIVGSPVRYRRVGAEWRSEPGAHVEFTGNVTVGNGAPTSVGTLAVDSSKTNDTELATAVAGGASVKEGVYVVNVSTSVSISATGRCFIDITANGITERVAWVGAGEDTLAGGTQIIMPAAGNITVSLFQISGDARIMATRVKITKVA